jgi:hypothetical protein
VGIPRSRIPLIVVGGQHYDASFGGEQGKTRTALNPVEARDGFH